MGLGFHAQFLGGVLRAGLHVWWLRHLSKQHFSLRGQFPSWEQTWKIRETLSSIWKAFQKPHIEFERAMRELLLTFKYGCELNSINTANIFIQKPAKTEAIPWKTSLLTWAKIVKIEENSHWGAWCRMLQFSGNLCALPDRIRCELKHKLEILNAGN